MNTQAALDHYYTTDTIWTAAAETFRRHANTILRSLADPDFKSSELDTAKSFFENQWPATAPSMRASILLSVGSTQLS